MEYLKHLPIGENKKQVLFILKKTCLIMAEKERNPSLSRIPLKGRVYAIFSTFILFDIVSEIGGFVKLFGFYNLSGQLYDFESDLLSRTIKNSYIKFMIKQIDIK